MLAMQKEISKSCIVHVTVFHNFASQMETEKSVWQAEKPFVSAFPRVFCFANRTLLNMKHWISIELKRIQAFDECSYSYLLFRWKAAGRMKMLNVVYEFPFSTVSQNENKQRFECISRCLRRKNRCYFLFKVACSVFNNTWHFPIIRLLNSYILHGLQHGFSVQWLGFYLHQLNKCALSIFGRIVASFSKLNFLFPPSCSLSEEYRPKQTNKHDANEIDRMRERSEGVQPCIVARCISICIRNGKMHGTANFRLAVNGNRNSRRTNRKSYVKVYIGTYTETVWEKDPRVGGDGTVDNDSEKQWIFGCANTNTSTRTHIASTFISPYLHV